MTIIIELVGGCSRVSCRLGSLRTLEVPGTCILKQCMLTGPSSASIGRI